MSQKEGRHQGKRETKDKEFYSVRSLVEEITGISENGGDSLAFNAAYTAVRRIIKTFQSQEGVNEGVIKIHKDIKEAFVKATKVFYIENQYLDILSKMRKNEELTIEEYDILIEHFVESMIDGKPTKEKEEFRKSIEVRKEDEFFEKAEKLVSIVKADMMLVDEVNDYQLKLQFIKQYEEILENSLREWRDNIKKYKIWHADFKKNLQEMIVELQQSN